VSRLSPCRSVVGWIWWIGVIECYGWGERLIVPDSWVLDRTKKHLCSICGRQFTNHEERCPDFPASSSQNPLCPSPPWRRSPLVLPLAPNPPPAPWHNKMWMVGGRRVLYRSASRIPWNKSVSALYCGIPLCDFFYVRRYGNKRRKLPRPPPPPAMVLLSQSFFFSLLGFPGYNYCLPLSGRNRQRGSFRVLFPVVAALRELAGVMIL